MRLAWIVACVLGEALGISLVATIYAALDRGLLPGGSVWILAAGAWEGLCLGGAQAAVLRRVRVRPLAWIGVTIVGAVVGYGFSLLGGAGRAAGNNVSVEPPLELIVALAAAMGVAMGALMGLSQWLSARGKISPLRWITMNAVGWAPAMIIIMLAATSVERSWSLGAIAVLGAGAGGAAGLFVGAMTSLALPKRSNDDE